MSPIPARAIFVWFGTRLPFSARVALRSALRRGGFDEAVIVHRGLQRSSPGVAEALAEPGVALLDFDEAWLRELPEGPALLALFDALEAPAARSNLARLAALWALGGVYLDTDTITVASLAQLRRESGFCGLETLCFPAAELAAPSLADRLKVGARVAARAACARAPRGHRWFRRIEDRYPQAVNNAVLGFVARSPVLAEAFATIARMPPAEQHRRYRLGPHLFQGLCAAGSRPGLRVLPSPLFYPLGPELSRRWFAPGSARVIDELLRPQTRVVHWYASVAPRPLTPRWVAARREDVALAALAAPYLD